MVIEKREFDQQDHEKKKANKTIEFLHKILVKLLKSGLL